MRQVIQALRQPLVRSTVVALTLAGLMVFGGTALARLPGSSSRNAVHPAAANTVTVLGKKLLKQHATTHGVTGTLLSIGGISTRAVCTDNGSGTFEVALQMKSTVAGTLILTHTGSQVLTSSYAQTLAVQNVSAYGYDYAYDVLTPAGKLTHYDAIFSVHAFGSDCVTRLAALSE